MAKFRKKPVVIEATQWFKNGDHPEDNCEMLGKTGQPAFLSEGKVVRYFRRPDVLGPRSCQHCGLTMHAHGWIDTKEGVTGGTHSRGTGDGGPKAQQRGSYEGWTDGTREVLPSRNLRNVWTFATQPYSGAHFATFPEELPRRCILAASKVGDLVLDPFGGSGTTGRVAIELRRRCVLLDLAYAHDYGPLAVKRTTNVQLEAFR